MNAETLKALQESIAHWERLSTGNTKQGEGIGYNHCALCELFWDNNCKDCPIYEHTKFMSCARTPYVEADRCFDEYGLNSPEFKEAALKELEFLKSLLPKTEGQNGPNQNSTSK